MTDTPQPDTSPEPSYAELLEELDTDKQRRFVQEYMVDLCAGAAAERAGYSKPSRYMIGYENLNKPGIKAAVIAGLAELGESSHISREWVIEQYKATYRRAAKKGQHSAARQALDSLAKSLGMFSDELNVSLTTQAPAKVVMYFPDNGRGQTPESSE